MNTIFTRARLLVMSTVLTLSSYLSIGQTTDLIISEYSEDANVHTNWLELYNGTGATVNLSDYRLVRFAGSTSATFFALQLSGTLADGSTYVVASSANTNPTVSSNTDLAITGPNLNLLNYSGNSAIALQKDIASTWTNLDVIGDATTGPWAVGGTAGATANSVLVRQNTVCGPETNWATGTNQWNISAAGTATNVGQHTANCAVVAGITVNSILPAGASFCVDNSIGDTIQIIYQATGTYTSGNQFTVELSDAAGAFTSPISLGSLTGTAASDTIEAVVPAGTAAGAGYRVRVVSSNPVITGSDNGSNLIVGIIPTLSGVATDVSCNGGSDGSIDITPSGTAQPFTYAWSNTPTTEDVTGLTAGSYTVTVTDSNGCTVSSAYMVNEPTDIMLSTSVTDASCGVNDGSIDLTVSGGTGPYTFSWSNTDTTEDITNLSAGTYDVTVTDAASCTKTGSYSVSNSAAVNSTVMVDHVSCNNGSDGSIDVTIQGGTPPFTYQWSTGSSMQDLTNLTANTYTVTITDSNACTQINTYNVMEPMALGVSGTATDALCNGSSDGTVDITVTGGTTPYTFSWSNTAATTEDLSNVAANTYTVTITDSNNCSITSSAFVVSEPAAIMLSGSATDATCNAGTDGAINLTVAGGTTPYTFSWTNSSATTEDLMNIGANIYTVTVTDSNSCTASASYTVGEPTPLAANPTVTDVLCNGNSTGAISTSASGGTFPYSYSWSTGTNSTGISNRPAGTYTLTLTDASTCSSVFTITITQPAAISVTGIETDITCNGLADGAIDASVAGGVAPYTYSWSPGGSTTQDVTGLASGIKLVTVTDVNNCTAIGTFSISEPAAIAANGVVVDVTCNGDMDGSIDLTPSGGTGTYTFNWSNSMSSEDLTGLAPNTYAVTITDINNCTGSANYTVGEPAAVTAALAVTPISCNGDMDGAIDLTVSGGTTPYTFVWSNAQTNEDLTNLDANTYSVTATDSNGCSADTSVTLTEPAPLMVSNVVTNLSCYGSMDGAIDLTVSGGTPNYTFNWSEGSTSEDVTGLAAGTYTGTVTDANGCAATADFTLTEPDSIALSFSVNDIFCSTCSGSVAVNATGGAGDFTYSWSTGSTADSIAVTTTGSYVVTVTDSSGCVKVGSADVNLTTGREEAASVEDLFMLFPNPATAMVTLKWKTESYAATAPLELVVWSLDGKIVHQETVAASSAHAGMPLTTLDVAAWERGMYLLQLSDNQRVLGRSRLVVSK